MTRHPAAAPDRPPRSAAALRCSAPSRPSRRSIVSQMSQNNFHTLNPDLHETFRNDIKTLMKVIDNAFSNEFLHSNYSALDLKRMRTSVFIDFNKILSSLKCAFNFPKDIAIIKLTKTQLSHLFEPIFLQLAQPFVIIRPGSGQDYPQQNNEPQLPITREPSVIETAEEPEIIEETLEVRLMKENEKLKRLYEKYKMQSDDANCIEKQKIEALQTAYANVSSEKEQLKKHNSLQQRAFEKVTSEFN
jgi:hypothetical protein